MVSPPSFCLTSNLAAYTSLHSFSTGFKEERNELRGDGDKVKFAFVIYSHKIYNNKQIQYKSKGSMEIHNNPKIFLDVSR